MMKILLQRLFQFSRISPEKIFSAAIYLTGTQNSRLASVFNLKKQLIVGSVVFHLSSEQI